MPKRPRCWTNTIPPFPAAINAIKESVLRRRAKAAWQAGHTILNGIAAFPEWWSLAKLRYRTGESFAPETGDAISREGVAAIEALRALGARRDVFCDNVNTLLAYWPTAPSDLLDPTYYVWFPEGTNTPGYQAIEEQLSWNRHFVEPEVRRFLDVLTISPDAALSVGKKQPVRSGRMSPEEANQIAMRLTNKNSNFLTGGVRDWARAIGCSVGTVQKTPLWQSTMRSAERGRNKGRKPKVVSLTEKSLAMVGKTEPPEETLARLKAEQEADYEPSPLDDDPGDKLLKVRCRRR